MQRLSSSLLFYLNLALRDLRFFLFGIYFLWEHVDRVPVTNFTQLVDLVIKVKKCVSLLHRSCPLLFLLFLLLEFLPLLDDKLRLVSFRIFLTLSYVEKLHSHGRIYQLALRTLILQQLLNNVNLGVRVLQSFVWHCDLYDRIFRIVRAILC